MRLMMMTIFSVALASTPTTCSRAPLNDARQLIVVTAADWDTTAATMRRFERSSSRESWRPAGDAAPVILGRTGLAWGRGLHGAGNETGKSAPQKREGDGKAPAGAFTLGAEFGFADRGQSRLSYVALSPGTECVDDGKSRFYNRIVERGAAGEVDWSSSEKMRSIDVYRNGLVVNHNVPPQPGGGSCIFLHLRNSEGTPTAGCTAMDAGALAALLQWLDPTANAVLVQLPEGEYARLRGDWGLPPLEP